MDWDEVHTLSLKGALMPFLEKLPRERWAGKDPWGNSLLHYAVRTNTVPPVVALLKSGLVNVNARNLGSQMTALNIVAGSTHDSTEVVEVLCAAGADLYAAHNRGNAPLGRALAWDHGWAVRVLIANGARLRKCGDFYHIKKDYVEYERAVLACRASAVALLSVKRKGQLWQWDKYLLREIALELWTLRRGNEYVGHY